MLRLELQQRQQRSTSQSQPRPIPIEDEGDGVTQTRLASECSAAVDDSFSNNVCVAVDSTDVSVPAGTTTTSSGTTTATAVQNPSFFQYPCSPQNFKLQRQTFLVFVRILMAYLERHDPPLRDLVRDAMRDCSKRSQEQEPGYISAMDALHERLREIVKPNDWRQVAQFTRQFLLQRRQCRCHLNNANHTDVIPIGADGS
ncbi:hypothetical protein ACA910_012244 [Epithemia clementina (nom. ined.)]